MSFILWRRVVVTFCMLWLAAAVVVAQAVEPAEPAAEAEVPPGPSLALDRASLELPVTIWPSWLPWASEQQASFTVYLRETSGLADAGGVYVTVEPSVDGSVKALLASKNVDFFAATSQRPTMIAERLGAGEQVAVRVELKNLTAGRYGAVLRFHSVGRTPEGMPMAALLLTVPVQDHWLLALSALLGAFVLSVLANVVLVNQRQRYELEEMISKLKVPWLRTEPPLLPVIWVRALLKQAEDRCGRMLLWGGESIRATLNDGRQVIDALSHLRDFRAEFLNSAGHSMICYRAGKAHERVLEELGAGALSAERIATLRTRISDLDGWLDPVEFSERYKKEIRKSANRLSPEILIDEEVHDVRLKEQMQKLKEQVDDFLHSGAGSDARDKNEDRGKLCKIDHAHAKLKLLWESMNNENLLRDLMIKVEGKRPLDEFFNTANLHAWQELLSLAAEDKLHLTSPSGRSASENRADDLINFEIGTGDPEIDRSFFFQRVMRVQWRFLLKRGLWRLPFVLELVSTGPRVTAFFLRRGASR
ncbi:MAG: hypothetical protein HC897_11185 [Thermoanaerobaculia bacterium]|nr:hypothetical protein [Thermoanaerobaculia bacterium]